MRSSLRGSLKEESDAKYTQCPEAIRLNTIDPKEFQVSVLDVNSNGNVENTRNDRDSLEG